MTKYINMFYSLCVYIVFLYAFCFATTTLRVCYPPLVIADLDHYNHWQTQEGTPQCRHG